MRMVRGWDSPAAPEAGHDSDGDNDERGHHPDQHPQQWRHRGTRLRRQRRWRHRSPVSRPDQRRDTVLMTVQTWNRTVEFASAALGPPHTDAFVMRCVVFRHDASTYVHGRIETKRNAANEKRIRVG